MAHVGAYALSKELGRNAKDFEALGASRLPALTRLGPPKNARKEKAVQFPSENRFFIQPSKDVTWLISVEYTLGIVTDASFGTLLRDGGCITDRG